MKHFFYILLLFTGVSAQAQWATYPRYLNTKSDITVNRGAFRSDSTFYPPRDTSRPFFDGLPAFAVLADETAWVWSVVAQKWVASGAEKHLGNTDLSLTANRTLTGNGYGLTLDYVRDFSAYSDSFYVGYTNGVAQLTANSTGGRGASFRSASTYTSGHYQANAAMSSVATSQLAKIETVAEAGALPYIRLSVQNGSASKEVRLYADSLTGLTPTLSTLTDSAVVLWNYTTQGSEAKVTLAGNRSLSITNLPSGKVVYLTLGVTQDATGSRTLSLPAGTKVINGGAGAVTLTTTGSATDMLSFRWNGTTLFCTIGKNYN